MRSSIAFNFSITLVLAVISISPFFYRNISDYVLLLSFLIWFVSAVSSKSIKLRITKKNIFCLWWIGYLMWQFLMTIIGHSESSPNLIIVRSPIFCIPIIMSIILASYNVKEVKLLVRFLFIIVSFNVITNVIIGIQNPDIFQTLNLIDKSDADYHTNAGSTSFVGVCMFFIPVCLFCRKNVRNIVDRFLLLIMIVLSLWFVVVINARGTAFFMLTLLLLGYFFVNREVKKNRSKAYYISFICIFGLLTTLVLIPSLQFLSEVFSESEGMAARMSTRFNDIISLVEGGGDIDTMNEGSFFKRILLWQASITTFLANIPNFLFGIGEDIHEADMYSLIKAGVGGHSEFFDCAAEYGFVGIIFMYKMVSSIFSYMKNLSTDRIIRGQVIVVEIVFVLYSFMNNSLLSDQLFIIFFVMPLVLYLIENDTARAFVR